MMEKGQEIEKMEKAYKVGALLYTPAIYEGMIEKIEKNNIRAMVFCLEDSIADEGLEEAERTLAKTLQSIHDKGLQPLPMIFIRVRSPKHLQHVHENIVCETDVITGYILPKFDLSNAVAYKTAILTINAKRKNPLYIMPILESSVIARKETREKQLYEIKEILDSISQYVLNVRVGGNDFCNYFGVRREITQTIYDVGVVRDILVDILNIYSHDYVVSAPVWEYFGKDPNGDWAKGLERELALDKVNGFIGKTCIHPEQISIINESLKVKKSDYEDALDILNWDSTKLGVGAGNNHSRMNEVKCHYNWAKKIYMLGKIYGVKE